MNSSILTLKDNAILADFTSSQFGVRSEDKVATQNYLAEKNIAKGAAMVYKHLFPTGEVNQAYTIVQQARMYHNNNTVPWDVKYRLLKNEDYQKHVDTIREFNDKLRDFLQNLTPRYEFVVQNQRTPLNGSFDRRQYPATGEEFAASFSIRVRIMPIADSNDFRLKVNEDALAELKKSFEHDFMEEVKGRVEKDLLSRIDKPLANMVEKLKDTDRIFRNSLVENILEVANVMEALNTFNLPLVKEFISDLRTVADTEPDKLRENETLRLKKAEEATKIFNKLQDYFAS